MKPSPLFSSSYPGPASLWKSFLETFAFYLCPAKQPHSSACPYFFIFNNLIARYLDLFPGIMQGVSTLLLFICPSLIFFSLLPNMVNGDCWLIEGDKGYVWLAICSQNQPPYETIPQHINNTVHDLRLNENKLKAVLFSSMYRFTNLTDLNLTKNEISYIEDGAFAGQANLQVIEK